MIAPRLGYLVAGLTAALGVALCIGPGSLSVGHTLAALASAAVAMLATATANLAISDWQADVQSRQAWATLGLRAAELSAADHAQSAWHIDPRYLASATDEALRQAFRSRRAAAQVAPSLSVPERALQTVVRLPSQATRTVTSWNGKRPAKEIGSQLRLVANGDAWAARPVLTCPRADRTADLIVLSGSTNDRAQPLAEASAGPGGTDSMTVTGCRGPPRTMARRTGVSANPLVHDNLGKRIPIGQAELDVIESYLERELRELLAGLAPAGDREDT